MLPQSSSDILASVQRAKRRSWTASQDPFASDTHFLTFFSTEVQEGASLASNIAGGSTKVPPVSPTLQTLPVQPYFHTHDFAPALMPDTFLEEQNTWTHGQHRSRMGEEIEIEPQGNSDTRGFQRELYRRDSNKLGRILDAILANEKDKMKLHEWLLPHALDLVYLASITPTFIENWTIPDYRQLAPYLATILAVAAKTNAAKEKNTKKSPTTTCNVIVMQLSYQRLQRSIGFAGLFGLFLWTTSCSKQTIEALHRCGLSVSYKSVLSTIEALANHCMELAAKVGFDVHIFCYDNVNISTSIFVEQ
ncbi:hypothetical protein CPC08DRAFT_767505 [Agrocybe pediades]|nr:hypothetical protein CPC08DRAFT_767505 [Agrocybe pediades]